MNEPTKKYVEELLRKHNHKIQKRLDKMQEEINKLKWRIHPPPKVSPEVLSRLLKKRKN